MAINFNTGPYYDDFDKTKNFYKVLYKPGYAVQARELNQMQSIQQHQMAGIGNHVFKKNSMVIPGGIILNNAADIVFVSPTTTITDFSTLVGKTITNATSFDATDDSTLDGYITAVVLAYREAIIGTANQAAIPACLYVKYFKGQTASPFRTTFTTSEILKTVEITPIEFTTNADFASRKGKVATLSAGVFYTNEYFVDANPQTIIVDHDSLQSTSADIVLRIDESIVTSDDDESLLDNANGAPNQYAPGADRYKIDLVLTTVDANFTSDRYILMMSIKDNVVTYVNDRTEYAELMKTMARRTYDANGNFIVSGLNTKIGINADDNYLTGSVSAGRGYIGGFEYNQISDVSLPILKPRDVDHTESFTNVTTFTTGLAYFFVAGGGLLKELPDENTMVQMLSMDPSVILSVTFTDTGDLVTLNNHGLNNGDTIQFATITTTTGISINTTYYVVNATTNTFKVADTPGGSAKALTTNGSGTMRAAQVIGYGIYRGIQFYTGNINTDEIYKAYFDWVYLEEGHTAKDIGGFKVIAASQGAPILHQLSVSGLTGSIATGDVVSATTDATQLGTVFHVSNTKTLYLRKTTLNGVPTADTIVSNAGTPVFANVSDYYISNYSDDYVPMIDVDQDVIKTLYNATGDNTTAYSFIRRDVLDVTSSNKIFTITLNTYETFEDFSTSSFMAYIVEDEVFIADLIDFISFPDVNQITFDVTGSSLDGETKTVYLYSTVNKINITEAPKTVTTTTTQIVTPSRSYMTLDNQDVIGITKVVDGGAKAVTFTDTGDLVGLVGHGLSNNDKVMFSQIITTTGLSTYKTYFVVNKTDDTFQVSLTSGGAAVALTTDGSGTLCPPPSIDNSVDITSRFIFESGDSASFTGTGLIKLRPNAVTPVGQIAVKYDYYAIGTGNYLSVDSYGSYTGDLGYIGKIADVKTDKGQVVNPRTYIDFRTRTSNYFFKNFATIANGTAVLKVKDLNLTAVAASLVGKYVVGPGYENSVVISSLAFNATTGSTEITLASNVKGDQFGTFYIGLYGADLSLVDGAAGAKQFTFPKDGARVTYSYTRFKPKHTLIYIDRNSSDSTSLKQMEIKSLDDADALRRNPYKLPIMYVYMEPYTLDLDDVTFKKYDNPTYQMLDIHNIKKRVDRTEYYTLLALSGGAIDASNTSSGLLNSGFGFWTENFLNPGTQDYNSPDYKATIYDKSYVAPGVVTRTVNLELDSTVSPATWQQTGTALTLPYVEELAYQNTAASLGENLNPYDVLDWSNAGKLTLIPAVDNWVDTTTAPVQVEIKPKDDPTPPTKKPDIDPPHPERPPKVVPEHPVEEVVTEVTNIKEAWGPDSHGGKHAITFTWKTNTGRTGRVNTDKHLSEALNEKVDVDIKSTTGKDFKGPPQGWKAAAALSMINKKYNEPGVKEYLNAGTQFDQHPPEWWKTNKNDKTKNPTVDPA